MTSEAPSGLGVGSLLAVYGLGLAIFLAIDFVWLGFLARDFYRQHLGNLLRADVNWGVAMLFYAVFVAGLVVFVVAPALDARSASRALAYGAFFGFVAYATYDLTNQATIRDWPPLVTLVDLVWGTALSASVAYLTYQASTRVLQ
jgi:uncharacterized membrane protein